MRKIMFRGKSIRDGEWYYGDLHITKTPIPHIHPETNSQHKTVQIDVSTVGQFIGLQDSNGTDVYEGDIITVNGRYPKLIKFVENRASFCMNNTDSLIEHPEWEEYQPIRPDWWSRVGREIKTIGNIHDNPELLRKEDAV